MMDVKNYYFIGGVLALGSGYFLGLWLKMQKEEVVIGFLLAFLAVSGIITLILRKKARSENAELLKIPEKVKK